MIFQRNDPELEARALNSRDVTQRKRMINFLAETQRAAATGGWEFDPENQVFDWSEQMYRIFETSPQEFKPTLRAVLKRIVRSSRRQLRGLFSAAPEPRSSDLEIEIVTLKANRIWLRLVAQSE